jgi:phosphatidylglycerophosphate synthase
MPSKNFLEKAEHSRTIAKVAIVVQTVLTCVISLLLVLLIVNIAYPMWWLTLCLFIDVLFIAAHLSYRVLYHGQKIKIGRKGKKILFVHVVSSLFALSITLYIVIVGIDTAYEWMCFAMSSWVASLFSGILFFMSKYAKVGN